MEYRIFGRTGLRVSIAGLGGGGASRLGLASGATDEHAIAIIRSAYELGINYFDTAEAYGTEDVIGRALEQHRDEVLLSSKICPRLRDESLLDKAGLRRALEESLRKLRTEVLDVYHLHLLKLMDYEYCLSELVPELERLRDEGKIRFIGVSENSGTDPTHDMLQRAVQDDCWDVIMAAFNLFNQSARDRVMPAAIAKNFATEIMIAARSHFSRPEQLVEEVLRLVELGQIDRDLIDPSHPLDFLPDAGNASQLTDVCYRFAAHEPGAHVVLVGTGSISHLKDNVGSLNSGALPNELREKLAATFGQLSIAALVPGRTYRT